MQINRLIASFLACFLFVGASLAAPEKKNPNETYRLLDLLSEVFDKIRTDYVEEAGERELIEAAINGMLTSLDPHSGYMNADAYKDMQVQTKGQFGGLGIEVSMEGGWVKVVSPIDDTPAHRAGLQPGDFITHIDDETVQGLNLNDAVKKMRGQPNTNIKITIRRNGKPPFDVVLTRAIIKIQAVKHRVEANMGYIRVTSFNEQTDTNLKAAVDSIKGQLGNKLAGYVLDLRNNPGGLLDQAIAVSDAFLDQGEIVSTRSRKPEDTQRYNAKKGDLAQGLPIVVLINDGSASASEIVAGALQDHKRAVIMGTKSFGKGSVQTIIPFPGHGGIRMTTARYYTPSGRSIQTVGIEPDINVAQIKLEKPLANPADHKRSEASYRNALPNDQLKAEDKKKPEDDSMPKEEEPKKDDPALDYQLQRALDLLQGMAIYRGAQAK